MPRALDSLMVNGLRGYSGDYTVELFDGDGEPSYMAPLKVKYPQIIIHSDGVKRGPTANDFWKWSTLYESSRYALLFPDDFIVCLDFLRYAAKFIQAYENEFDAFSFYTPYIEICEALKKGHEYWRFPGPKFYGGLGLAIKSNLLKELVAFTLANDYVKKDVGPDIIQNYFFSASKRDVCACVPNLVQHIGSVSTVGHGEERLAPCFIGENRSPLQP